MFYIVATPIGNLKEITFRAVEVLKSVDLILAEDTRHSLGLMKTYDISVKMISYQKFNERSRCDEVIGLLKDGKNIALISDAGMPLISDPGNIILSEIIKEKLQYTVISGACAAVNAVVLSGLDTSAFCMAGFLPEKNIDRNRHLDKFCNLECTLVFYISPHSIEKDLKFLFERLGARKAALVREISKIYEEVVHFNLGQSPEFVNKGEFAVCIQGAESESLALSCLSTEEHIRQYIAKGLSEKDAIKKTAFDRKVAKSVIYNEYVQLKK